MRYEILLDISMEYLKRLKRNVPRPVATATPRRRERVFMMPRSSILKKLPSDEQNHKGQAAMINKNLTSARNRHTAIDNPTHEVRDSNQGARA